MALSASLREGGGPRSGGRSLRNFGICAYFMMHAGLPQSRYATAPSRREPCVRYRAENNFAFLSNFLKGFVYKQLKLQKTKNSKEKL